MGWVSSVRRSVHPRSWPAKVRGRFSRFRPVPAHGRGGMSEAGFVTALYRGIAGRDPDPSGLAHHVRRLEAGASPEVIARAFVESEEVVLRSPVQRRIAEERWRARSEQAPSRPPLVFLHIMKTGGTTLTRGLRPLAPPTLSLIDVFLDHLVVLPRHILWNAQLVTGHLSYEAVDLLAPDVTVCTVVRDPVERTLSHYWHMRNDPAVLAEIPDFGWEHFLASPVAANYQARYLAHRVGLSRAWIEFSPVEQLHRLGFGDKVLPLQTLFDGTPLAIDEELLAREALARLDGIEFVGVTEHLDALFARLAAFWGVDVPPPLQRANVGQGRPRPQDVPAVVMERIRAANAVDVALYERARSRAAVGG